MSFGPELISALSKRLDCRRLPARIYKIETGDVWAAFRISSDQWLFLSWHSSYYGAGVIRDDSVAALKQMKTPKSSFGEALKRNFLNGTFLSAKQLHNDRLLLLESERLVGAGFKVTNFLLFEGMERNSNLILLDEKLCVLDAAKHIHADVNRYRTVLPGNMYTPPPPLFGNVWSERTKLEQPQDLQYILGIGRHLVKTVTENWERFPLSFWKEALAKVCGVSPDTSSLLLQKKGGYLTVFPVLMEGAEALDGKLEERCGEEAAERLLSVHREKIFASVGKVLEKEIRSRRRHLDGLRKQVSLSERGGEFKKIGELLLASAHHIPDGASECVVTDWETGEDISIPLDDSVSLYANAERYFKKYKKGKVDIPAIQKKIEGISRGIVELEEQIDALESIDDPRLLAAAAHDILEWIAPKKNRAGTKKKKEEIPPHIRFSHEENEIFVGLNARGNRYVTFKAASSFDLWFHVHEIPGAHVILKMPGENADEAEESVLLAASLAAWFSKARHSTKVQIDYTRRKNVRSIPGSAIAHVTYTNPQTVQIRPDLWKEYPEAVRSVRSAKSS